MTTKNKQYEITRTILDGQEVRGTVLNKRKYYFLSDLKKVYGTKFISYLPTNPITLRISVAGNSQTRDLVNVSEFKDSFRKYKQSQPVKKTSAPKTAHTGKKHNAVQLELGFTKPEPPAQPAAAAAPVANAESDALAFRAKTVRANINKTIEAYSRKEVAELDNIDVDQAAELKKHIVKNYLKAYDQFDIGLAATNNITVKMLGDHGLGVKGRSNGRKYLDTIQSKGLLEYLAEVVEHMFGDSSK